ncbi:glucose-6-phosphate 3-dehydrogenase [Nicoletella semolina]|uniref:Glucose-6-phosphate 3-dehydrogenase n=1 Tax=Nicoletella semolina TaxID=271160 RepID=A0A4R2N8B0_9PAST|nr:Gfo/Idh/MocA family oxidoreductase [Nicoletella semolina]MDH2923877.1 NTD biosynthesis operon oxidoreductase ntdC [Nicoletella semolina]TCP17190.1 glucose-6-phosphate 3-dehydrogenase [Nicoletella semolina]
MIIGIVGCGGIAYAHAYAMSHIKQITGLALYGRAESMLKLSESVSLPTTLCDSLEQLAEICDAFVICTPNHLHVELAKQVLAHKKIPLLCEKPLSTTLGSANQLVEIAPPKSIISFNYRYNRVVQRILQLIENNNLGKLVFFSVDFNRNSALTRHHLTWKESSHQHKSSGALGDLSCHLLDLFCLFSQSQIALNNLTIVKGTRVKSKEGVNIQVDDNGYILGTANNGTFFRIHASKSEAEEDLGLYLNLIFEKGEIRYSIKEEKVIRLLTFDHTDVVTITLDEEAILTDPPKELPFWADSFIYLYKDWVEVLTNSTPSKSLPYISQGLHIQEIMEKF